jgi:ABC-type nitrate/sulfonate/bicarbonate transport system substrate-binding protein
MRDLWSRRRINTTALALLGSAGLGIPAHAATALRVGKAVSESIAFVPVDIGVKRGIFQKAGLDLEILGFPGGAKMHQALAAGSLDIALGSGPDLPFIVHGEPARAVATIVDAPAYLVVLAQPDGSVKTLADLKGKMVNVASLASLTGWLGNKIWQTQGWTQSDLRFTTSAPSAGLALLRTGQIAAMVTDGTFSLKAEEQGAGRIIYNFGSMVKDFHTHLIFASDELISSNPAAVTAFIAAWFQTVAAMRADREQTIKDLGEVLGLDTTVATQSYDAFMPMFKTDGHFEDKALAVLSKSFVEMGTLPTEPKDLHKLYTEDLLPKT